MDQPVTILDVLTRAAADPAFRARFAQDPLDAASSVGLRWEGHTRARFLEDRLRSLAHPADREATGQHLADATDELRAAFELEDGTAATEAVRALLFWRDYRFHQRHLNHGEPAELAALVDAFETHASPPSADRGTLLITLHYGPFPLLWLWLKHAQLRGHLPPFTLLYDTRLYTPDISAEQYARLAAAEVVPEDRRDLDLARGDLRATLREAVARLRAGETILMFADAAPVEVRPGTLVCRVGRVEVGYPRGAVWLAQASEATVQGVVIRPKGDGHELRWGNPKAAPVTHEAVNEALQELLDASVANDPAPWLAWFTEP
jgi:hypothetical protein